MLGVAPPATMNSTTLAYPQDSIPPFLQPSRRPSYSSTDRSRSDYYYSRPITDTSNRIFAIPSPSSSKYSSRESLRTPPSEGTMASADYSTALLPTSGNIQNGRSHVRQYDQSSHSASIPSMNDCYRQPHQQSQDLVKRKPVSPPARRGSFAQQMKDEARSRRSSTSLAPPLTVPTSINPSKGSLAEFAAQITCLFWFESSADLARVAASPTAVTPPTALIPDAIPSMSFRKWVATILSTTQVSQNVILLALLFIYRLKKLNPTVKGKAGSEYRLLTVALMLGNKFLDDNTYTNKTWAEVSGITVGEIHVMEVEFLSNMRYSLFTSKSEWEDWHDKLGRFGEYWERAQRVPASSLIHQFSSITPTNTVAPSLPSPPSSNHASPPYASSHSPSTAYPPSLPTASSLAVSNVSPSKNASLLQRYREDIDRLDSNSRKRGLEDVGMQPPAKRLSRSGPSSMIPQYPPALNIPTPSPNPYAYHVPMPSNPAPIQAPPAVLQPQHQPFLPTTRAMSTVYSSTASWGSSQTATSGWNPQSGQLPAQGSASSHSVSVGSYPTSRHTSPYPLNSSNNSPTTGYTNNNSPSVFLTSRESPYRPVRSVSTLLVSQHAAEAQHIGQDQMQYQPLTKARNEFRQGPVPYMQTEYWPQPTNWNLPPNFES
ncbi:hypothetical protein ABW19_dt0206646 [Dactylella cylindrospora]|nr:hypothetical protein ABW19_dt0206646 [Dactylella cylindrospora]